MRLRRWLCAITALLALAVFPAIASADVLISQGPTVISCDQNIRMGVWYQSYSGGPRWARLTIKSTNGHALATKRVTATTTWRYYFYTPRCGHRYRVVYTVPSGQIAYTVRVRY